MDRDAMLTAGDIARLADVGRAAVSNWRRRHDDFPEPAAGTATSPLFSLSDVEAWFRRNGKPFRLSPGDRIWHRLRASGDDLQLGRRVGAAGAALLDLRGDDPGVGPGIEDPELVRMLADLAAERGHEAAFEFLYERYLQAHSRRVIVTDPEVAALMARLAGGGTVFDPCCGMGTILMAAGSADAVWGQEISEMRAGIATVRLMLAGVLCRVVAADPLHEDAFAGEFADAVVCHPPFNERDWGYDELTGDPRWEYGLPPRTESELAWVQHCLSHVKPGGRVAILMPGAAAGRRAGKRIRGNLLRAGALRAVFTLIGTDLWLLRRPRAGEAPPATILLMDCEGDPDTVEPAWTAFTGDPSAPGAVAVVELLDDEVDLTPSRRRPQQSAAAFAHEFGRVLDRFRAATAAPPTLDVPAEPRALPLVTIGELARAGLLTIKHAGARVPAGGDVPVLTGEDVAEGGPPSGRAGLEPAQITVEPGDVVATPAGAVRVIEEGGAVLGPYLTLYRADPARLDPGYLAGLLHLAHTRTGQASSRVDVRRTQIPRLPLSEQQAYGQVFRQLIELTRTLQEMTAVGDTLVRLSFDGLLDGHLK